MSQNSILELEFKTDTGLGNRANIGIIVLRTDQTLEHEFANLLNLAGVALYHSRIPNEMEVTKENLGKSTLYPTQLSLRNAPYPKARHSQRLKFTRAPTTHPVGVLVLDWFFPTKKSLNLT
ncbi:MAG: hypothetical protein DSY98_08165, partial [SAR324 cluster bacterium]